jgi:hypothetical protein
MLLLGPARFGQVYYLGTVPFAGHADAFPANSGTFPGHLDLHDVLVATHKDVECRLIFNPLDGQLAGLEMAPDENTDPCEIYFSNYHEVEGRLVPHRLEARYGDSVYHVFDLKKFVIQPAPGK